MTQTKKKLYALLVAVDKYQATVPVMPGCRFDSLAGCVNDAQSMLDYLKQEEGFDLEVKFLKNEEATKKAVTDNLKRHLGQAGENDVALFYYSGHGLQEHADPELWKEETDGKLECLICYNKEDEPCLLADKELRYLIHEIASGTRDQPKKTPPHILTIFDCCHSGENTRNGFMTSNDTRERRVKCIAPQRDWSDFIFENHINPADLKSQPLSQTLPEGIHLHLSACEADESALEVNGNGVFTSYLTNILRRAQGNITYYDLMSQVRPYLKNTFKQKPQLRLPGEDSSGNYATFLNKAVSTEPLYGNVIYNHTNGWILDMGSLMGISRKTRTVEVEGPNGETFSARIQRIQPDETFLKFRGSELPNKNQVYKAIVKGLMAYPVKIFINNFDGNLEELKKLLDKIQEHSQYIVLEEEEANADYTLQIRDCSYYITKPENAFRPLVEPVQANDSNALDKTVSYLHHISQWEYVRRLKNAHTYLFAGDPIKVEAFFGGQSGTSLDLDSKIIDLHPQQKNGKWAGKIALKLTNTTSRKLYVSTLYLPIEFRVFLKGTDPQVYTLEPDESVWVFNWMEGVIGFSLDDIAKDYNWEFTEDYLKIIVSTTPFDVARLEKKGLPRPPLFNADTRERTRGGLDLGEKEPEMVGDDWTTQDLTLRFYNPAYNQVDVEDLRKMVSNVDLSGFARGLYFDAVTGNIKEEIQIDATESDRLEIKRLIDQKRNDFAELNYSKRKEYSKGKKTLIAFGDGWLHNNSLRNLSVHLSGHFNVYPLEGAAGSSDHLKQVIANTNSGHLVVSLGLDEVLHGKDTQPVLDLLKQLSEDNPDLKIITHGYDNNDFDQEAEKKLNQFNEGLESLASDLANLEYTDLRNSLQKEQWNSGHLPNEDGFEKLAGLVLAALA
jgi:hypothetical protein